MTDQPKWPTPTDEQRREDYGEQIASEPIFIGEFLRSVWLRVDFVRPADGQTVLVAYEHGLAVATYHTRFVSNWQGQCGPLWGVTHWAAVEGPKS